MLGEDHPDTFASRNNLACAYQAVGDLGRAIPLYERALADGVRMLGEDHPATRAARGRGAPTAHPHSDGEGLHVQRAGPAEIPPRSAGPRERPPGRARPRALPPPPPPALPEGPLVQRDGPAVVLHRLVGVREVVAG
ncbi:tetratricopeptide repeat protein, partial [Streptomyces sp. SP17KL33]|uniref:tetratricopeptide repeat protein n=1 Tax=Streptomyces sp. SP17KL33 TaxID=3002534 RepID=UPI002E770AD5